MNETATGVMVAAFVGERITVATRTETEPAVPTSRAELPAMLEALGAVLVWGASFIATKVALRDVSPVVVVWLRFTLGVAILGAAVVVKRQAARLPGRDLGY